MSKSINMALYIVTVFLLGAVLISCSGSSGGGVGTLELGLTDLSTDDFKAIYVTIAEVQVNKQGETAEESGWETIMTPGQTFNLLELVNGVMAPLGVSELAAGRYGQMRLILGDLPETPEDNILGVPHPSANYFIDKDDNSIELTIPSGYQTGIKIVKGFTIVHGQSTEMILDFDAARSVVRAGNSGKWLLKPTIKVLEIVENSVVTGVVQNSETPPIPLAEVLVSAQIYYPDAVDPANQVVVETSSRTTEEGEYALNLPPDIYTIVTAPDGYLPACQTVDAQYYDAEPVVFSLEAATEFLVITVHVEGLATEEDSADVSFRQNKDCGDGVVMIEVDFESLANGDYTVTLPTGTYDVVASADGETTQEFAGFSGTTLNIVF
jgi:hypothetical protein